MNECSFIFCLIKISGFDKGCVVCFVVLHQQNGSYLQEVMGVRFISKQTGCLT